MGYELYPHQKELITKIDQAFMTGVRGVMVVSPAGSGKSIIIAKYIKRLTDQQKQVFFMVHRKELVEQITADLIASDVNMDYVVVTSVIKLNNHLGKLPEPYMIVTDETHHSKAKTYLDIYDHYHNALLLGFTATPIRLSGEGFKDVYNIMVEGKSVKWLIDNNYLAPYEYYSVPMLDRKKLQKKQGEYTNSSIDEALGTTINGQVVQTYLGKAKGQQAILYAHSIEYSKKYAAEFEEAGIAAVHIDSKTPAKTREKLMDDFKQGKFKVLCNVDLISEGFNVPDCNTVILLRPTESLTIYVQQAMRGMRYKPNKKAIIIDHVGNYLKHGLPDTERFWSIEASHQPKSVKLPECSECGAVFTSWIRKSTEELSIKICPVCGEHFEKPIKPREENVSKVEDETVELEEIKREDQEMIELRNLARQQHKRFRWNLKIIVRIFLARNKVAALEGRRQPYKSPIYFAIRQFLEINDLENLNRSWFDRQIYEIVQEYGQEYKLNYPYLKRYAERLIPEYQRQQSKKRSQYS